MPNDKALKPQAKSAILNETKNWLRLNLPETVRVKDICDRLGLSASLVSYYFGDRDQLVAEAIVSSYEDYVAELREKAMATEGEPIDRLFKWIECKILWTEANPGIAASLNFPAIAGTNAFINSQELSDRFTTAADANHQLVKSLIKAARKYPTANDFEDALDAAVVGWLTLGMAIWLSGNHMPTRKMGLRQYLDEGFVHLKRQIQTLLELPPEAR